MIRIYFNISAFSTSTNILILLMIEGLFQVPSCTYFHFQPTALTGDWMEFYGFKFLGSFSLNNPKANIQINPLPGMNKMKKT